MSKNCIVVLSGPSGVGKSTIQKELLKKFNMFFSISCTTRSPRVGEQDGKEYFFITKEQFKQKIKQNGFLEYSEHFNNFYGTPADVVFEKLKNQDVLLDVDVNGGLEVKKSVPNALLIMILPPSKEELINRLHKRNTDDEESILNRVKRYEYEESKKEFYDYVVINDNLNDCINEVIEIINKEKEN